MVLPPLRTLERLFLLVGSGASCLAVFLWPAQAVAAQAGAAPLEPVVIDNLQATGEGWLVGAEQQVGVSFRSGGSAFTIHSLTFSVRDEVTYTLSLYRTSGGEQPLPFGSPLATDVLAVTGNEPGTDEDFVNAEFTASALPQIAALTLDPETWFVLALTGSVPDPGYWGVNFENPPQNGTTYATAAGFIARGQLFSYDQGQNWQYDTDFDPLYRLRVRLAPSGNPPVPAPLPLLGVGFALQASRRLRRRLGTRPKV